MIREQVLEPRHVSEVMPQIEPPPQDLLKVRTQSPGCMDEHHRARPFASVTVHEHGFWSDTMRAQCGIYRGNKSFHRTSGVLVTAAWLRDWAGEEPNAVALTLLLLLSLDALFVRQSQANDRQETEWPKTEDLLQRRLRRECAVVRDFCKECIRGRREGEGNCAGKGAEEL